MSFLGSLVGKNPKISLHSNPWTKINSNAIVKTGGKAGTFKIDLIKVALSALAFLVACLVGAPLNFILVGIGSVCLYAGITRYAAGPDGEAKAEGSRTTRTVGRVVEVVEEAFI